MEKSSLNKKLYIIFMFLFILYLFKADRIMLHYFGDSSNKLETIDFTSIKSNSEVNSNVDMAEYIGGLFNKVYFQGWAYCETGEDNPEKQINLIFKSLNSDLAYIVRSAAQTRHDVYATFKDTKQIYNELNGIETQFSTIPMKNGKYQLFVNVIENSSNYGIGDTGLIFVKDDTSFKKETK